MSTNPSTTGGLAGVARPGSSVAVAELDYGPLAADVREVFDSGRTKPIEWRMQQLKQVEKMMVENSDNIIEALAKDLGRPPTESILADIGVTLDDTRGMIGNLKEWMQPVQVTHPLKLQPGKSMSIKEPKGIVFVIGPWNYPINLTVLPLIGAIAAGNCCVIKPSEVAPASAALLEEMVNKYLDTDAIRVVQGEVPETTALLACEWDHIFYTGNGAVGRIVMEAAAKHLTPVTLELGGKTPVIVDKDVNMDVAVNRILHGKFSNNGQTCVAPDYVLVDKDVKEEMVAKMQARLGVMYGKTTADVQSSSSLGRIVNENHFGRVSRLIETSGGNVLHGGMDGADKKDKFIPPTIVDVKDHTNSALMQEEIFGPVLPIMAVDNVDEAVKFINDREKPLALYVFSSSNDFADNVISSTTSGGSCVNDCVFHLANPHLPFGGVGPSGMGAYHGKHSFDEFSHSRSIMYRDTWIDPGLRYPPYDDANLPLMKKVMVDWAIPDTIAELFPNWLHSALPWFGGALIGGLAMRARL